MERPRSRWFERATNDSRGIALTAWAARTLKANVIDAEHREQFLADYRTWVVDRDPRRAGDRAARPERR